MREEEEFVLKSIAKFYSGDWQPGGDPPDGYLTIAGRSVAIEVSTLTQHVTDDRGTRSRLSDDLLAIKLANELDAEMRAAVPVDKLVMLVLRAPIVDYRKTKVALANEISSLLASNEAESKVSIRGNQIEIYLDEYEGNKEKRIVAAVMNRAATTDILKNVIYILEDRITVKAEKCRKLAFDGPVWLALLNDYFLTDADTYRYALKSISVEHPFERILLVSGSGAVDLLVESADA